MSSRHQSPSASTKSLDDPTLCGSILAHTPTNQMMCSGRGLSLGAREHHNTKHLVSALTSSL